MALIYDPVDQTMYDVLYKGVYGWRLDGNGLVTPVMWAEVGARYDDLDVLGEPMSRREAYEFLQDKIGDWFPCPSRANHHLLATCPTCGQYG